MNIFISVLVGGLVGWAASQVMGTGDRQGLMLTVAIGAVSGALGGWLFSNFFDAVTLEQSTFKIAGLVVSSFGAVIGLALAKLTRLA